MIKVALTENHSEHQRTTPFLLHAKEDFPVIQPAIVIRVSVHLAEPLKKKKGPIKRQLSFN